MRRIEHFVEVLGKGLDVVFGCTGFLNIFFSDTGNRRIQFRIVRKAGECEAPQLHGRHRFVHHGVLYDGFEAGSTGEKFARKAHDGVIGVLGGKENSICAHAG